jgi:hypothetical protein
MSGETITVACKLPNGVVLRIFDKVPHKEPIMGGGFQETWQAIEVDRIELKGWWQSFGRHKPQQNVEGTYALTHGVPKDKYLRWLSENKESHLVKNGIVFGTDKADHVEKKAAEQDKDTKSGAEPLDPSMSRKDGLAFAKDPRFPRGPRGQSLIEEGQRGP